MEKQLSFQIESSSSSKIENQQEIKRVKHLKKSAQKLKRFGKTKKRVQQDQLNISKQTIEKTSLEQWVSELLTGPKKELKLKALSLEKEVDREKQLSEASSLKI